MMCGIWGQRIQVLEEPERGGPTPRAGEAWPGIQRRTQRVPGDGRLKAVMEEPLVSSRPQALANA